MDTNSTTFYSSSLPTFSCSVYREAVEQYASIDDTLLCVEYGQFNDTYSGNNTVLSLMVDTVYCNAVSPVLMAIFGEVPNCITDDDFISTINTFAYYFIIIAVATILIGYLMVAIFQTTAERQIYKMRLAYYRSVLRQDIAWFDENASGEVASRLVE